MGGLLCKTKDEATGVNIPNSHEVDKVTSISTGVDKTTYYLDFPFIVDCGTREHVKCSKIMFILRGLPGCGKSTITSELKRLYDEAVVCSADEYFFSGYKEELNASRFEFAHQLCKEKAEEACQRGTNVIIIDNTNIYRWQMKDYASLAKKSEYSVIVVEPQTACKFSTETLTKKCVHGESYNVLVTNIEQWETFMPLYYGWFLNEAGSRMLHLIGQAYLEECLKVPAFEEDFKNHCNATGCKGLVMTPRTYGARVKLDEEQFKLWSNDTLESSPISVMTDQRQDPEGSGNKQERTTFTCHFPLVCVPQMDVSFQPTKGPGSRAHVTLGCADNISPVTTGLDLLEVVEYESQVDNSVPVETFELSRGVLRRFGMSSWVLYLNKKIYVKTLFTGFY